MINDETSPNAELSGEQTKSVETERQPQETPSLPAAPSERRIASPRMPLFRR
jgi:hypothetical protein